MLITPTGMAYDEIGPRDIVFVDAKGEVPDKKAQKPSSEWRFHLAAYRARPDMNAVVHTHSLHATVLACAHKPIPAFHYMVAVAGGSDIPLVPYDTFGTQELARYVAQGPVPPQRLPDGEPRPDRHRRDASPPRSSSRSEVEVLATQYCKVLALGEPVILPADEMARVLKRFKSYGQRAQD